jgi:hypothetical protein
MKSGILFSVGAGGKNVDADVEVVQAMLNNVPMLIGPPTPLLKEDGDCGPLTVAAIKRFQKRAELNVQDGRIDPGKTSHQRLAFVTDHIKDLPARLELANLMAPFANQLVNGALNILFKMKNEENNFRPPLKGPEADRARAALRRHFGFTAREENDGSLYGRVLNTLASIRVMIDARELHFREATMKQAKIDTKHVRGGDSMPSVYRLNPGTRSGFLTAVFTPNYKQFDPKDGLGWGPMSLSYELIKGLARVQLDLGTNDFFFESDQTGYPDGALVPGPLGRTMSIIEGNPASYGAFCWEIRAPGLVFGKSHRRV